MGIFGDFKDWYDEQKRFKEAEDYLRKTDGQPTRGMGSFLSEGFNDIVVNPTKQDYKELKQDIKKDNQILKNDFKDMTKEVSPPIGAVVEKIDILFKTATNPLNTGSKITNINELKLADHLFVHRNLFGQPYTHHAIYAREGYVIHYEFDGESLANLNWIIDYAPLEKFSEGNDIYVADSPLIYSPDEVVIRAHSRLYERGYNLFENNCEHFVRWCRGSNEY